MGAGDGGFFGVGGDDALFLVFLVGLFGGELLGGFDGVFDGVFGRGVVDFDTDVVVAAAFFALKFQSVWAMVSTSRWRLMILSMTMWRVKL